MRKRSCIYRSDYRSRKVGLSETSPSTFDNAVSREIAVGEVSQIAYSGVMAWSEEQKAKGREELARRKAFSTASTYRAAFLKWFGWMILNILMSILFATMFFEQQNWLLRASDIIFFVAVLAGLALSGSLSYVRFLDWRRATATEHSASIA
jgi:hypothetical protein